MCSATKFTKTRRRLKAAKHALLRARKVNKLLAKRKRTGLNPTLSA